MSGRLPHRPGLDRVRGAAVAAVVAYHLGHLRGGFLGVDVFFVLSGFLVTSLLLAEVESTDRASGAGSVDLVEFWRARFRRLVPAVMVVVPVVLVAARAARWPANRLDDLAVDGLATATWWENWRQIAAGQSYWDPSPSPFRHAWSLAIEEQFYVLWPLLVVAAAAALLRWGRGSTPPRRAVGVVAAAGATASAAVHLRLAATLDDADLSRVYLGTDTRVFAILVGCALATTRWGLAGEPRSEPRLRPWPVDLAGVAGAGLLAAMALTVHVDDPALFRSGGFLLATLAAAALTVAVARPRPDTTDASFGPLRVVARWAGAVLSHLGLRSYGIYLWSWPTQVLAQHRWPDAGRPLRSLLVVGASLVVAEASYRLLEQPLRRCTGWARDRRRRAPAWAACAAVPLLAVVLTARASAPDPVHEALETEDAIEIAMTQPGRPPTADDDPAGDGDDGLHVLVIGDSVSFTVGYYKPAPGTEPDGIAWVDSRSVIGCGLLAADGWEYRSESGGFEPPSGGDCAVQAEVERLGLAEQPDVVVVLPGAWEVFAVRSPEGEVVEPMTDRMAAVQAEAVVSRARAAHEQGAAFVVVAWACPGDGTPPERRDPDFIRWFDSVMAGAVDTAVEEHGVDARYLVPGADVCEGGITGTPTEEKHRWMGGSNHVPDQEAGERLWYEWLGPALVDELGTGR